MKRTLMMTAAFIFGGQMAFAAIDPQALADSYIAEGYTYVEVKQGPTQTKIEAVKGATVVEVVYDNESGSIVSQESQAADAEEMAQTGVEVKTTDEDFEDNSDENDDAEDDSEDDDSEDDGSDDDGSDDDGEDDDSGDDSSDDGDDDGDSDSGSDESDND